MSYQISQSTDAASRYVSGDALSSVRPHSADGSDFIKSLSSLLDEDTGAKTGTFLKSSDEKILALKGHTQEQAEEYSPKLSNRIRDLQMLDNQAPSTTEWNKAFNETPDSSGWSMLESLGSGLLTAAKIAGAIALF